jgi:hypothetical protein
MDHPDSACGASPGPAESEDHHIADGSSASSAVQVPARIVKLRAHWHADEQTEYCETSIFEDVYEWRNGTTAHGPAMS